MELNGKVALVTGAARRVGRAIAEELGRAGATVVVHYHASPPEAVAEVERELPGALSLRADLRSPAACADLLEAVRARHGRLDLLVNSAAGYERGPFSSQGDELWEALLELNLIAPARLIRLALPLGLVAVVNIVDVAAWQPWRNHAAYAASKAGLVQLTRCLALELAPTVRVNGVAPGTVAFPPDFTAAEQRAVLARIPLAEVGSPGDVARAVRFLLAEDYLTGVILPVDGGAGLR
ncbi:MAG TPA: SDR family oxidoreductase [Polyangia bacterium]|nr:SDR family oxidoreductase [Polyangia bacterium]